MVEEPFVNAPLMHPFRHPSFRATQLRALNFAESYNRRLLWVAAYDKILTSNVNMAKDKEELRKSAGWNFMTENVAAFQDCCH
eukprot:1995160-Karenia_brevis.AAC.1